MFGKTKTSKIEPDFRYFNKIEGTEFLIAALAQQEKDFKSYNFITCNYLFFNSSDFSTRWLFPTNRQVISRLYKIPSDESENIQKPENHYYDDDHDKRKITKVGWLLFVFVDFEINPEKQIVALADFSGENLVEVVKDVDLIYDKVRISQDILLLAYKSNGKKFAAEIKLSNKQVTRIIELPKINE